MSRTTAPPNTSPQEFTVRTFEGIVFIRASSRRAEGTVFTSFTCSRFGMPASSKAFSATSTEPPQASGTNISKTDRSKQMEVENSTPDRSSGGNTSSDQWINVATLLWQMATPLGFPVEPEV